MDAPKGPGRRGATLESPTGSIAYRGQMARRRKSRPGPAVTRGNREGVSPRILKTTTYAYDLAGTLTNLVYSDSTPGVTNFYDRGKCQSSPLTLLRPFWPGRWETQVQPP